MIYRGFIHNSETYTHRIVDNAVFDFAGNEVGFLIGLNVHNLLGAFWFGLAEIDGHW